MADAMTTARNKVQQAGEACTQTAASVADNVKNTASYFADEAKSAASRAAKQASEAGSYLDSKAEEATSALGGSLRAAGDAIRQNVPQEGRLGQASSTVAQGLSDAGSYLEREGLQGIGNDLTSLIKNNPIPALLLGIGLGFLMARASTPRS